MKEFTREELEQFNGQNGQPAYVAVGGKVYDVSDSKLWKKGQHMRRHNAGADLSEDLASAPHGPEMLEKVKLVGTLKGAEPQAREAETPGWAQWLLDWHPHPMVVHFPQALLSFAPLFLILFYAFDNQYFERTAYYLMVSGAIMSIPTIATGFFHWVYKFAKAAGGVYRFKIAMSFVLLGLTAAAAGVHTAKGSLSSASFDIPLLIMYLLCVPIIASVGHAGGIIVFGGKKK